MREELGRERALRETAEAARLAAERERDELRAHLSTMVETGSTIVETVPTPPVALGAPAVLIVEGESHPPPPMLWQRLRRVLGGV